MRVLYAVLIVCGIVGLWAIARYRRAPYKPGDLGPVSDEWRAEMRAKGRID